MKEEELRKKIEEIMLASTPEDVGYHADKIIQLMKSSQDEIIKGYKIQLKTAWEQIDILKAEQEKNYISIEEHNKVIDKTKECIRAEQEKERCIKNGNKLGQTNWSTYCNSITYRSQCNKEYCIAWEDCVIRKLEQERQSLKEKIDEILHDFEKDLPIGEGALIDKEDYFVMIHDKLKQSIGTEKEKECSGGLALERGGLAVTVLPSEIPMLSEKIDYIINAWCVENTGSNLSDKQAKELIQKLKEAVNKEIKIYGLRM